MRAANAAQTSRAENCTRAPAQRGMLKPLGHCRDKVLSLAQDPCKALSYSCLCNILLYKENEGYNGITDLLTDIFYLHEPPQYTHTPPANCSLSCHIPKHFIFTT